MRPPISRSRHRRLGGNGAPSGRGRHPFAAARRRGRPQLGDALAALDSRDYATARRLFEGLGRGEAAQAIDTALAALDRKDYATAQGLFEALATLKPNAPQAHAAFPAPIPLASKPEAVIPAPPAIVPASPRAALPEVTRDALPEIGQGAPPDVHKSPPPLAVVPDDHRTSIGAASAPPPRRSRRLAAAAVLALLALCGLAAFHRSREWALAAAEGPGRSGLASAVAMIEAPLKAIGGSKEDRDAVSTLRGQLAEATMRLEKLEKADAERDARVDGLSARLDQGSASANQESGRLLRPLDKGRSDSRRGSTRRTSGLRVLPPPARKWPTRRRRKRPTFRRGSIGWKREPTQGRPPTQSAVLRRYGPICSEARPGRKRRRGAASSASDEPSGVFAEAALSSREQWPGTGWTRRAPAARRL